MRWELLALHRHHKVLSLRAKSLGRARRALRQQIADALPLPDQLGEANHGFGIAVAQLDPARVFAADQSLFKAVHRPGDRGTTGDGVHPIHVAELVGVGHCAQVVDAAVGAEGGERLVLRAPIERISGERPFGHLHHPLAAYGAGVAGIALLEDGLRHRGSVESLGALEVAAVPVVGHLASALVLRVHHLGRAEQPHAVHI